MPFSHDVAARVGQATGLDDLLDAAYDAFADMLALIRKHQDPDSDYFAAMLFAAASAANGRDYVGEAPSLPCAPPEHQATQGQLPDFGQDQAAAEWLANLSAALASKLDAAATSARLDGDRRACEGATRCAREITELLHGPGT